eukprot:gene21505-15976_t
MLECVETFQEDAARAEDDGPVDWIRATLRLKKPIVQCAESALDKNFFAVLREDGAVHFACLVADSPQPYRASKPVKLSAGGRGAV